MAAARTGVSGRASWGCRHDRNRPVQRCHGLVAFAVLCAAQFMLIVDIVDVAWPSIRLDAPLSDAQLHLQRGGAPRRRRAALLDRCRLPTPGVATQQPRRRDQSGAPVGSRAANTNGPTARSSAPLVIAPLYDRPRARHPNVGGAVPCDCLGDPPRRHAKAIPLLSRLGPHAETWSAQLPSLFQRRRGNGRSVIGAATILHRLKRLCGELADHHPAFATARSRRTTCGGSSPPSWSTAC
jgi:hypothetical protein